MRNQMKIKNFNNLGNYKGKKYFHKEFQVYYVDADNLLN